MDLVELEKKPEKVRLRLKMVDAVRAQLRLLQQVDRHPNLYNNRCLIMVAIYRYEMLWLPLKAAFTQKDLVPPLDIYWVWHCHMLSPLRYRDDTYRVTGTVVDHKYMKSERHLKEGTENARTLWKSTYPSERFEINVDAEWEPHHVPDFKSKISYDLVAAIKRQQVFYYQVAMSHYKDRRFLKTAVERYKRYLCLKAKHIGTFLVPCYDFDLVWHTHLAHPSLYAEETLTVLDRILNHDDSVTDRQPNSKLQCCEAKTRVFWNQAYPDPFAVSGAMYRGDPPQGDIYEEISEQINKYCSSCTVTEIRSISLMDYQPEGACTYLSIHTLGKTAHKDDNVRVFHKRANQLDWPEKRTRHYGKFQFNSSTQTTLRFSLTQKNSMCCCLGGGEVLCSVDATFRDATGYGAADVPKFTFSRTVEMNAAGDGVAKPCGMKVRFSGTVIAEHRRACLLRLEPEATTVEGLPPEDWQPVLLPTQSNSLCFIKTLVGVSRLVNHENKVCYRVRVLHSTEVMTSAVFVYQEQGLLQAVAHSVSNDQIPTPAQVSSPSSHIVMDPSRGERAMVIKDSGGDWAFCVGRWAVPKHPNRQGNEGFLHIKIYNMATGKMSALRLPRPPADHHDIHDLFAFNTHDMYTDLQTGRLDIAADAPKLAPRIALSCAISVLYLLCKPESTGGGADDGLGATGIDSASQTPTMVSCNQEEVQLLATTNGDHHHHHQSGATDRTGGGACGTSGTQSLMPPSSGLERKRKSIAEVVVSTIAAHVTSTEVHVPLPSCSDMTFMVAAGYACFNERLTLIPSNDYIYRSLGSDERLPNVWYDSGGSFGGHDGNFHEPDGGSVGGGSFGACSGDAADEEAGEADGGDGEEGGGIEEADDEEEWVEGQDITGGQGACGSCGACGACGGCGG